MKRFLHLVSCLVFVVNMHAQTASEMIDKQVWEPFKKAYANSDAELYNYIHTDDVLRITERGIRIGDEYKKKNIESFSRKDRKPRTIDFVFEHRIHEENIAYEVGYYKLTITESGKAYVGRFNVVLKKEEGQWKIAQDWDTSEINGIKVTVADFERLQKQK